MFFTVESANELAISLASGKLPVKLDVVEERTVGPDLGKDSIEKGASPFRGRPSTDGARWG